MKKAVTVFLAAVLLTSMIGTTVLAEDIDTVYVDQNFDDAALGFDIYDGTLTDGEKHPINVLNHATGLNMPWMTVVQNWDGTQWLEYSDLLEVGTNPDETTNYAIALPIGKVNVILSLNIDTVDEEGNATASPVVYEEDKLIYMDMKIKRQSTTDNRTSLFVRDSAGREIYSILYDKGKMLPGSYETLSADVNYGSYDSEIPINYPRDDQWHFIRTIFNFDSKTFKIYIGTSADDLEPMVPSEPDIGFKDPDASDLYSIAASDDGEVRWYATTLAIDDLKIYSVSLGGATIPVASDITLEGKPNIGEILTGRYGTFSDTKEEGSSYCYWETSDDINFMDPVKITEDTPIASGGTNNLVLSEAHKGKYIRFVVVPVNIDGDEGSPAYSTTDYKIGCITYTLKTTGATKGGGTKFEPKYDDNYYAGSIDIVNTSDQEFNAILIAAWYQDDQFKKLYTAPVSVAAGTSEDSGVVTASISTDSEHFTRFAIPENTELKILLWDDLSNIKPLTAFLKIIS